MRYRIEKYNPRLNNWESFGGGYSEEEVKEITKGYKDNGLFYERQGSRVIFIVTAE